MRILLLTILLAGCATTSAPTFSQLLATAETADDAVVLAATSTLQAGAITSIQAKKILTITDGVNTALTLANNAYAAGHLTSANAQIAAATAILVTVQRCLNTVKSAPIDACLTPVSTP